MKYNSQKHIPDQSLPGSKRTMLGIGVPGHLVQDSGLFIEQPWPSATELLEEKLFTKKKQYSSGHSYETIQTRMLL